MELSTHFDLERQGSGLVGVWHKLTCSFRDNKYAALGESVP